MFSRPVQVANPMHAHRQQDPPGVAIALVTGGAGSWRREAASRKIDARFLLTKASLIAPTGPTTDTQRSTPFQTFCRTGRSRSPAFSISDSSPEA